ncbi:MAG TPA: winged helix-turn-helix domain-containing protein [Gemmatimonadaceae bacterium]|nr:winged helix-turn-helix domain-containing protein [Gemmatimonadaceae bacterium]
MSADRSWMASATAFLVSATRALSTAETALEALEAAMRQPPDVAVIAPPLGGGSALGLIAQLTPLRDQTPVGVVYVTEREREFVEHVRLMRAGANDWFPRGLPAPEAARRIAALMDEIRSTDPARPLRRGPLTLDFSAHRATVGGAILPLTDREFAVLEALARAAGRIMSAPEIAVATGARRGPNTARVVAASVDSLHEKLGAARGLLESSRRHGYRLRFVAPP